MSVTSGYIRAESPPVIAQLVQSQDNLRPPSHSALGASAVSSSNTITKITEKKATMAPNMLASLHLSRAQLANLPQASIIGDVQVVSQSQIDGIPANIGTVDLTRHNQAHLNTASLFPDAEIKTTTTKTVTTYRQYVKVPVVVVEKTVQVPTPVPTLAPVVSSPVNSRVISQVMAKPNSPLVSQNVIQSNQTIPIVNPVQQVTTLPPPMVSPVIPPVQPLVARVPPIMGSRIGFPLAPVKPMTGVVRGGFQSYGSVPGRVVTPAVVQTNAFSPRISYYNRGYDTSFYGSGLSSGINVPINLPPQYSLVLQNVSPLGHNINVSVQVDGQMVSSNSLQPIGSGGYLGFV